MVSLLLCLLFVAWFVVCRSFVGVGTAMRFGCFVCCFACCFVLLVCLLVGRFVGACMRMYAKLWFVLHTTSQERRVRACHGGKGASSGR